MIGGATRDPLTSTFSAAIFLIFTTMFFLWLNNLDLNSLFSTATGEIAYGQLVSAITFSIQHNESLYGEFALNGTIVPGAAAGPYTTSSLFTIQPNSVELALAPEPLNKINVLLGRFRILNIPITTLLIILTILIIGLILSGALISILPIPQQTTNFISGTPMYLSFKSIFLIFWLAGLAIAATYTIISSLTWLIHITPAIDTLLRFSEIYEFVFFLPYIMYIVFIAIAFAAAMSIIKISIAVFSMLTSYA